MSAECGKYCGECPLKGKADVQGLKGPEDARFLVVTDSPNYRPEAYGRLMSQSALTLFGRNVQAEGFTKSDFAYYPRVRCPHDPDLFTTKEKRQIAKSCRPYLVEAIRKHKPEAVLPLGAEAAKQVFGQPVKITKVRGLPARTEEFGAKVLILPLLNPLMAVMYPQHEAVIAADCATLGRLVDSGYDTERAADAVLGDYQIIDDLQFLIDARPEVLGYDTENTGLRWFAPDAATLTMQFCIEPGKAYLLPWDHPDMKKSGREKHRLKKQLRELLCNPGTRVVGQNAKYDAVYTYAQTGIRYPIGGCTLMLATLLDENATTKNLDDLVKRWVPELGGYADSFNASVDKGNMIALPLDEKFVNYAAGDADAVLRLERVLYDELKQDPKLLNHYHRVTIPGLNAFASMELRGMHIDEDQIDAFEEQMAISLAETKKSLLARVPRSIKRKHIELKKNKGELSFTRPDFLQDILFHHEDGLRLKPKVFTKTTAKLDPARRVPSISTKDHLPYFYDEHPFVFELAEYIKASRILTANVQGFREKYLFDGLVRPVYNLHVAVTGRSSSDSPNGQNYPKRGPTAKAYRRMFVAPPGCVMLEADLSQAELRIAADMANDPTMIRIYQENGDIHAFTACDTLGVTMEQFNKLSKDERAAARFKAKAVNFGFIYGMGWRKFIAYAKTQYGVTFTEREAQRIRTAFFARYFKLQEWHTAMREYARRHKFVRSYSGRIRHLPMIDSVDDGIRSEAERQGINAPVQEFGSSLGVMACGRMHEELDPQYLFLVGFVHDALYAYVPEEYVEWGAKTLRWYMESNPLEEWFGRRMKVPVVADVGFGLNLGEIYEMGQFEGSRDGNITVGTYDFAALFKDVPAEKVFVRTSTQRVPPRNGRLAGGPYTCRV